MMRGRLLMAALLAAAIATPGAGNAAPAKPDPARAKKFAALPDWTGMWLTENDETSIGGISQRALDARNSGKANPTRAIMSLFGFDAPWNDEGKKWQAAKAAKGPTRKADGWGYPMMMNAAAPVSFLVTPEEVLVISAYRDVRHIYTDGRKHPDPDDVWPTVWGDSIGHWEGDTLVVDTIQVRNPNAYFHGAPALSDQAHYVERIRLIAPGRLQDDFTITDPVTLAKPWTPSVIFTPAKGYDRMVSIDFDNDRTGNDGVANTIEPTKRDQ